MNMSQTQTQTQNTNNIPDEKLSYLKEQRGKECIVEYPMPMPGQVGGFGFPGFDATFIDAYADGSILVEGRKGAIMIAAKLVGQITFSSEDNPKTTESGLVLP